MTLYEFKAQKFEAVTLENRYRHKLQKRIIMTDKSHSRKHKLNSLHNCELTSQKE